MRAWIEILIGGVPSLIGGVVALFVRAWIEMYSYNTTPSYSPSRSLRESVD